jgi:alpha-N-acetylglucosaminidase
LDIGSTKKLLPFSENNYFRPTINKQIMKNDRENSSLSRSKFLKLTGGLAAGIMFPGMMPYGKAEQFSVGHENPSSIIDPAHDVIRRTIGKRAKDITLEAIPAEQGRETYQIEARGGQLKISGSSTIALTYGFYRYLKKACQGMITWGGKHLDIPPRWPNYSTPKATTPYQFRYYFNVVTFGYSTVYWDWQRWQKELDWMALHGINMPLAMVGTEGIEARVWKKLGLTPSGIKNYFTGPAYLPWNRMGNIAGWDGPLPDDWLQGQIDLQHKILDRMRQLGMSPIAPAFGGFVPQEFRQMHSDVTARELKWGGFPKKYRAYILSPKSSYFKKIGKLFVQEWEKEFGKNKYFLSDSFNEMMPPVPEDDPQKKYAMMANYGKSIYQSIAAGDSDAVWVTQGWMFGQKHDFWDPKTVQSYLSEVPDDKMIILDMTNEFTKWRWHIPPIWRKQKGFYGKKWINSFIPNMGGNSPWTGDLSQYATAPVRALNSPYSKNLNGLGFAPEGIETNEVIYELLSDMAWQDTKIDLDKWMPQYCRARYGGYPEQMLVAWRQLRKSVYSRFSRHAQFAWQISNPRRNRKGAVAASVAPDAFFQSAVNNFLACSAQLKQSQLYRNDAIKLASIYLGIQADHYYKKALSAQKAGKKDQKKEAEDKVIRLLTSIDRLLVSHPESRLSQWVQKARSRGKTAAEKNYYEQDAKRILTVWGGRINDYAAKMWSGLIRDYYIPRVKMILSGDKDQLESWEQAWIEDSGLPDKIKPYSQPVDKAKQLVNKYSG